MLAYKAACEAYKLEFDWMAFLDSDEFLVTADGEPVNEFLARFDTWSAVAINWAIFGSNGHDDAPEGLVVNAYTRRAAPDFFPDASRQIHHPAGVRARLPPTRITSTCTNISTDIIAMRAGSTCCGRALRKRRAACCAAWGVRRRIMRCAGVNHYFTRSRAHWRAKLKRGYPADFVVRKEAEFTAYDRNEVEDAIATRDVEGLAAAVARLRAG